jgi:Flp pilus assembly protein TadD
MRLSPPRSGTSARTTAVAIVAASLALAWALGCSPSAARTPEQKQARAQQLIDSGNQAYRVGDYRLALRRYAAGAVLRKDDPAAYYGMGMALSKMGRDEEARRAYGRARELAQKKPQ